MTNPITDSFADRHIGPNLADKRAMLAALGVPSVETLIAQAVPKSIRLNRPLDLPEPASEAAALAELAAKMSANKVMKSFVGAGFHGVIVPPVIQRNLFENPAWYTAYTPYQSEISQGRLELLFHFQTLVAELTGLPVASASLLDEASAVAEAVGIAWRHHREKLQPRRARRARCIRRSATWSPRVANRWAITLDEGAIDEDGGGGDRAVAGHVRRLSATMARRSTKAKTAGALVDLHRRPAGAGRLAVPPAELGADIAVGAMQRFGVPMGFGGPHAAYCAVSDKLTRLMPGRLVGQSVDRQGSPRLRLARADPRAAHPPRQGDLQHLHGAGAAGQHGDRLCGLARGRRDCGRSPRMFTASPRGLPRGLKAAGVAIAGDRFFDTVTVEAKGRAAGIAAAAETTGRIGCACSTPTMSASRFDETSDEADLAAIAALFGATAPATAPSALPGEGRGKNFLTQPVFHENRSETEMMRFLRRLADKDLALDRAMIPLGSCTMKLNAAAEMMPVSWPSIANLHPFAPPPIPPATAR